MKCMTFDYNSTKHAPIGPINNIPAVFEITACRRLGDKPLFESMML